MEKLKIREGSFSNSSVRDYDIAPTCTCIIFSEVKFNLAVRSYATKTMKNLQSYVQDLYSYFIYNTKFL